MSFASIKSFDFNGFRVDVGRRIVSDTEGNSVPLTPKVFDLLLYLVQNQGNLLTKDELMAAVWPDTIVEESNLAQNVSILRRAIGDVRGDKAIIVTIPGRGYKFVAEVTAGEEPENDEIPSEPTPAARSMPAVVVAGIVVLIIAAATGVYYFWPGGSAPNEAPKTLAILPFRPLVNGDSDEALEMGMTDTLIARMSSSSGLILRPLSSVRPFARADVDPQAAGRALGADTVLEGNIQRSGDKIRINVRLINVGNGEPLWSGTFDDKYTDIFAVQDAISGKVSEALRLRLVAQGDTLQTQNVEAYRLYLQGRLFQYKTTPHDIRQAIAFYEKAIELDPTYSLAYAGVADSYRMLPITSDVASAEAFPRSKEAALRAIELDSRSSQSRVALGYIYSWYEWNWKGAETELRQAIELDPNNADAHRGLSLLLTVTGRHDEAINEMRTARRLDPLSLPTNALEAQALHYAGRDEEAIERINKTFEIDRNFWIARLILARIYIGQERWKDALDELKSAQQASGGNTETISLAGFALARSGQREEALKLIAELRKRSDESYSPSYNIAIVYHALGDEDQALSWLEDATRRHDVRLILLKVDRKWDGLRSDPRFGSIIRRIGLE